MGLGEDVFQRLRTIFEGEFTDRMAALSTRTKLSPGVLKTLLRLATNEGLSMGEMARGIGCDPSYITTLIDDLEGRGLARREAAPHDRRVKIIVLTAAGRIVADEIAAVCAVPPVSFSVVSATELRQLRGLLDKVIAAGACRGESCLIASVRLDNVV